MTGTIVYDFPKKPLGRVIEDIRPEWERFDHSHFDWHRRDTCIHLDAVWFYRLAGGQ